MTCGGASSAANGFDGSTTTLEAAVIAVAVAAAVALANSYRNRAFAHLSLGPVIDARMVKKRDLLESNHGCG
jgi:hypothetical protein